MKKGMIKVSVMYPKGEGSQFNMEYYSTKHVQLVGSCLGDALKGASIESGLAGGAPGSPAPYMAMGHMFFDTVEDFQTSFGPAAERIMGDLPNFTNVEPEVQISEVII